jgi:DNA-binding NarL/FixJ family response regulator
MQFDIDPLEKEFVYQSQLKEVSGRSFTNREIDVLSCLLGNRKDKKIASLLSLSPKTVGAHI